MENKTSHIDNHLEIMAQVLDILKWTSEEYFQFQYECGLKYLAAFLPDDSDGQKLLESQKLFWNWWKNHWYARDEMFVRDASMCPVSLATDLYYYLNDAQELVADIKPTKAIVGEQFATEKIV